MLFVEAGAVLPMVDPISGETAERMVMLRYGVRRRAMFPKMLFGGGVAIAVIQGLLQRHVEIPSLVGELSFLAIVVGLLAPAFLRKIEFHIFVTLETMKKRQRIGWAFLAVLIPFVILGLITLFLPVPEWMVGVCLILLLLLLMGSAASWHMQRRLKCGRRNGDSFEIWRVHPDALLLLMLIQDRKKVTKS